MISPQLKTIFVDIPKTGSTTLKRFLLKSYYPYHFHNVADPLWIHNCCPENQDFVLNDIFGGVMPVMTRHEPLLNKFKFIGNNIYNHFIFTCVRDPFSRFISAHIELLMYAHYNVRMKGWNNLKKFSSNNFLMDPLYVNQHAAIFQHTGMDHVDLQTNFLLDTLHIILGKGGFGSWDACQIETHFWPQYLFLKIASPKPIPIHVIHFEKLSQEFEGLKKALSSFTGLSIMDESLPNVDPLAEIIFLQHHPKALPEVMEYYGVKNMGELEGKPGRGTPEFVERFPTFEDYLIDHKKTKKQFIERLTPFWEENRKLIETVYDEDYKMLGYTKSS
jgi:hypothetical protein